MRPNDDDPNMDAKWHVSGRIFSWLFCHYHHIPKGTLNDDDELSLNLSVFLIAYVKFYAVFYAESRWFRSVLT